MTTFGTVNRTMNSQPEHLTLEQAARIAGVSRMTILRACHRGEIDHLNPASGLRQPGRQKVLVFSASLTEWMNKRTEHARLTAEQFPERSERVANHENPVPNHVQNATERPLSAYVPADVHSQALELSSRLLDQLRESQAAVERSRMEAEQARGGAERARQEAERERRRADQLANEVGSYQRALAESAESLAEERARAMQAVAVAGQVVDQVESLADGVKVGGRAPATWSSRFARLLGIRRTG